jgi:type I restriction enzyme S subunit
VPKLNQGNLREIPIPLPPLAVQGKLVSNAEALERETNRFAGNYQQKVAMLDALKRSLLHQAFTGQL